MCVLEEWLHLSAEGVGQEAKEGGSGGGSAAAAHEKEISRGPSFQGGLGNGAWLPSKNPKGRQAGRVSLAQVWLLGASGEMLRAQ